MRFNTSPALLVLLSGALLVVLFGGGCAASLDLRTPETAQLALPEPESSDMWPDDGTGDDVTPGEVTPGEVTPEDDWLGGGTGTAPPSENPSAQPAPTQPWIGDGPQPVLPPQPILPPGGSRTDGRSDDVGFLPTQPAQPAQPRRDAQPGRDMTATGTRPPPPAWDPSQDNVVRLRPDGTRVVEPLSGGTAARGQPGRPVPAQPDEPDDDPWLSGGSVPPGGGQPAPVMPPAGTSVVGARPGGARPGGAQPGDGGPSGYVSKSVDQRVLEQVTRLGDRPGARDVKGYPSDLLAHDDAGMALTPGTKPALVVFFDDGSRASDLQAARLLPMIARLRSHIVFVPLDRSANAPQTHGGNELARRYLGSDVGRGPTVPTLAVLDKDRKTRLFRPGMTEAAPVEAVLRSLIGPIVDKPAEPTADPMGTPGVTDDMDSPPAGVSSVPLPTGVGRGDPTPAELPSTPPAAQPASTSDDLGAPPGGSVPSPVQPDEHKPTPGQPAPVMPPSGEMTDDDDPWLSGGDQPAPTQPAPIQPAPIQPAPVLPAPEDDDPWLSGGADAPSQPTPVQPAPAQPGRGDPDAPPAGSANPFDDLPTGTARPRPDRPAPDRPAPDGTGVDAPAPGATDPAKDGRSGLSFTAPEVVRAKRHADRLRSAPGDRKAQGYPSDTVTSVGADRVLASGLKPCVVIFYDDASKASDLQAAEFLPLLVRRGGDFDLVLIDVGTKARWSETQKRVVRTYYNFITPTTVVLAANRAPIKSWYSRIKATDLQSAIDQALSR